MARRGLLTQLRNPPGGRDARTMLTAQFLDRTGTGVWNATAVLYFTVEAGFDARRIGLMIGAGGVAGVLGSPVAGRLAARYPVRWLLTWCHLLRMVTLCVIVSSTAFGVLQAAVALTVFGDRAAKTLEMLFAAEVAGPERDAYRVLILVDALSFAVISLLLRRIRGAAPARPVKPDPAGGSATNASPWRDAGYLGFVLLDIVMTTDDPVLNVGLPLWLLTRTKAPHTLVPAFLIVNTVLVVALQLRVSAATNGPRDAAKAVGRYGLIMLACCACLAAAAECDALLASVVLLTAAALQTLAELMRSVSSWELAVSLAPVSARPAYLGVAGMSQSVQKSVGPLVLTGVVMAAGPLGWLGLGGAVAGLSVRQRRGCLRKLDRPAAAGVASSVPCSGS